MLISVYNLDSSRVISCLSLRCSLGANPSAEEAEEALEGGATQVNNVVHSFRLQQTNFDKKGYLGYLKVSLTHAQTSVPLQTSHFRHT